MWRPGGEVNKPKSPCQAGKEFLHLSKDEVVFGEVLGWSDLGLTRGRILLADSVVEGRVTPDSLMGRGWLHGEFLIRQTLRDPYSSRPGSGVAQEGPRERVLSDLHLFCR